MITVVAEAYSPQTCCRGCAGTGFYACSASVEGKLTMVMVVEQMHIKQKNGGKNTKKFLFLHLMCCSLPWSQGDTWADYAQAMMH